jgi:hypothetical protein
MFISLEGPFYRRGIRRIILPAACTVSRVFAVGAEGILLGFLELSARHFAH